MPDYPAMNSDKLLPLKLIAQRLTDDPDYLNRLDCPYAPDVKAWLTAKLRPKPVEVAAVIAAVDGLGALDSADTWATAHLEVQALYKELKSLRNTLGANETSEKIQVAKAQAGLLEKLIVLGDRAVGHKRAAEFMQIVIGICEDILSPDQRTVLMQRLGETA